MVRRLTIALVVFMLPAVAYAQQKAVVLRSVGPGPYNDASAGFQAQWKNSEEVVVADGARPGVAETVRSMAPDVIFAIGPAATELAARYLPNVPVVTAFAPVPTGTLLSTHIYIRPEVPDALLIQRIKRTLPDVERVGVLYDPEYSSRRIELLAAAARAEKLSLVPVPVTRPQDIAPAFRDAMGRIDALLFIPDETVSTKGTVRNLLRRCLSEGIPAIGYTPWFADNGATMTLSVDYRGLGVQAAEQARRAAGGGRAVAPTAIIAIYNLRVARKLGTRVDIDFDDPFVRVLE